MNRKYKVGDLLFLGSQSTPSWEVLEIDTDSREYVLLGMPDKKINRFGFKMVEAYTSRGYPAEVYYSPLFKIMREIDGI